MPTSLALQYSETNSEDQLMESRHVAYPTSPLGVVDFTASTPCLNVGFDFTLRYTAIISPKMTASIPTDMNGLVFQVVLVNRWWAFNVRNAITV
jgi:hypothetical protein